MAAFWKVVPTIGDTPIFHWEEGGKWFLDRIDGTEEREREILELSVIFCSPDV